jgi:hypothetical protein
MFFSCAVFNALSKAFGFEDEPEYSDCEHDSESDSDDLTYFCHNF